MKLTKIAVALVAALSMSVVMASSASAAEFEFKSNKSPVMLFGQDSGNHVFKVDGQSVTCTNAVFEKASQATPTKEIPGVNAAYNGCTAFGFAGASVNMGNCSYTFKRPANLITPKTENTPEIVHIAGNVAVVCNKVLNNTNKTEDIIPVTVNSSVFGSECSVSLNNTGNSNLSKLLYQNNNPAAGEVLVTAQVTGITATKNKDNGLCPLSGTGTTTNATYDGPTPVKATEGIGISVA